jgi:branched-chain amino acid transport system substrate-binding protein
VVQQKRFLHLGALLAGIAAVSACGAPAEPARPTVAIGVDVPLAGRDGGDGIMALHGIELAVAQVNATTDRAVRFELVIRDTSRGGYQDPHVDEATDPIFDDAHGADDIRAFAADTKLLGVLGPLESNVALAEIPIAARSGLALLSASARDDRLTHVATPNTFFRLCAPQAADATAAARAISAARAKRVFVVDDAQQRERDEAGAFTAELRDSGTVVAERDSYGEDFSALLRRIIASGADTVLYFGPSPTGVLIMRPFAVATVLAPSRVRFMADSGFLPPAGPSPVGHPSGSDAYTIWPDPELKSKSAPAFESDFRRRYDVAAPPVAAAYFAAARVLMSSILSASAACRCTPARSAVVQALRRYRNDDTVLGRIAFAASGERTSAGMALIRIRGESYTVVKEFSVNIPR